MNSCLSRALIEKWQALSSSGNGQSHHLAHPMPPMGTLWPQAQVICPDKAALCPAMGHVHACCGNGSKRSTAWRCRLALQLLAGQRRALPLKLPAHHQKWCQTKALAELCMLVNYFYFPPTPNTPQVIAFLPLQHESANAYESAAL